MAALPETERCPLIAFQQRKVAHRLPHKAHRVAGLVLDHRPRGIASLNGDLCQLGSKMRRHQRHIAQKHE